MQFESGASKVLRHDNECPRLATVISNLWSHTILHDLFTQTSCGGAQIGILVLGITDAFVCAHNHHRHNRNNPGNFEDSTQGRIRLLTATTPAYAHAFRSEGLGPRAGDFQISNSSLLASNANYRHLPTVRTTTRLASVDFRWWVICTDGKTHTSDGKQPHVGAQSPALPGRCATSCSGQSVLPKHTDFAGACQQTNNTAGNVEALQVLLPPWAGATTCS